MNQQSNWRWIIIVTVIILGIVWWQNNQSRSDCEDRALIAATDTYPIDEYPDTNKRAQLQEQYERRYISQNCR